MIDEGDAATLATTLTDIKVSDEPNAGAWLICLRADELASLADNLLGVCAECKAPVQFSRSAPKEATPVCTVCAAVMLRKAEAAGDEIDARITPRQLRELETFYAPSRGKA